MNSKKALSSLLLLLASIIWGSAFIAQSLGMAHIGPLSFVCVRSFIGFLALLPVLLVIQKIEKKPLLTLSTVSPDGKKHKTPAFLRGGITCGFFLTVGMLCQQTGVYLLTVNGENVGKAGFITTLYILLVPLLLALFFKKKVTVRVWISVGLALVALYLLSFSGGFSLALGDFLLILCAFGFAAQIIAADIYVQQVNGVLLSCMQFLVCALITVIPAILIEHPTPEMILPAWKSLLYTGALSSGVAFTLQIVAQKHTDPTVASLLMSCESVFAVISAFIVLHETPSPRELAGSVIMFGAIILAQLPPKEK